MVTEPSYSQGKVADKLTHSFLGCLVLVCLYHLLYHVFVKWIPCHHSMANPWFTKGEDSFQMQVTFSVLEFGMGITFCCIKQINFLWNLSNWPRIG